MATATWVPEIALKGRDNPDMQRTLPVLGALRRTVCLGWSGRASLRRRDLSEGALDTSEL